MKINNTILHPPGREWFSVILKTKLSGITRAIRRAISKKQINTKFNKRSQDKNLRIANQQLSYHLNNSPLAIIEWDKNFIIKNWSNQAEKIFEWNKNEVVNKHISDLNLVYEQDLQEVAAVAIALMQGKVDSNKSLNRNYTKSGKVIYCQWFNSVLKDENGKILSIQSLVLDITEQVKSDEKIRQLSQTVEQSPASVVITDIKGNIQYVNPKFTELTGYTEEEVLGQNPRILKSGYTSSDEYKNLWKRISSGHTWMGELHNKKKNGEFYWENALISPILNMKGEITNFLAIKEDITDRRKAQEDLLASRTQFQNLVESISGTYWITDLDANKTIYVSPSFETISGRKSEDLFKDQATFIKAVHPDDRKGLTDIYKNVAETNNLKFSYRILKPNGEVRWISAKSTVITNDSGHKMEYGYAEDITERKLAEEALKESEETFRRLFDESADPVLLLDDRGFIDCNQSAVSILGYTSKSEVIYKKPWEISPVKQPDGKPSLDKAKEMISKALQLRYYRFEWIHSRSDGAEFPVEVMLTPIILRGKQSFYTVWRDISERKKAEKEKLNALERYDILAKATSDTIWDWDINNNRIIYNNGIKAMFGYPQNEIPNGVDWWTKNVHPDDRQSIKMQLRDAFNKMITPIQMEYRYRCFDGTYKYILDRCYIVYNDGKPVRIIGAMQDITYQKEEESRLGKVMIDAQERERQQIGMELHDNVKQILSASLLYMGMVGDRMTETEKAMDLINTSKKLINDSITELRRLSHQLAPSSFEKVSLTQVAEVLIENMNIDNRWNVVLDFNELENAVIHKDIKVTIYRILQEQLNNIAKYANASVVKVSAKLINDNIVLIIADNGIGFDPNTAKKGIGLQNIGRRADLFSGKLNIRSAPGSGCELVVELPSKNVA